MTSSVLNSGIHNLLDRVLTITSGDASSKTYISLVLGLLWPDYSQTAWAYMPGGLCCSNLFMTGHFLRKKKIIKKYKNGLRKQPFLMSKCKINVSLNNVKIKGEEHLRVFLQTDQLGVAIQIYFLSIGNAEL